MTDKLQLSYPMLNLTPSFPTQILSLSACAEIKKWQKFHQLLPQKLLMVTILIVYSLSKHYFVHYMPKPVHECQYSCECVSHGRDQRKGAWVLCSAWKQERNSSACSLCSCTALSGSLKSVNNYASLCVYIRICTWKWLQGPCEYSAPE